MVFTTSRQMCSTPFEEKDCTRGDICGPGYSGVLFNRYVGIEPYLYFQFTADRGPIGTETGTHQVFSDSFNAKTLKMLIVKLPCPTKCSTYRVEYRYFVLSLVVIVPDQVV